MNKFNSFCLVANGYIENYQRECAILDDLYEHGVYVGEINSPLNKAVEVFLDSFGNYVVEHLLELADNKEVEFEINGKKFAVTLVEEYADFVLGLMEE